MAEGATYGATSRGQFDPRRPMAHPMAQPITLDAARGPAPIRNIRDGDNDDDDDDDDDDDCDDGGGGDSGGGDESGGESRRMRVARKMEGAWEVGEGGSIIRRKSNEEA